MVRHRRSYGLRLSLFLVKSAVVISVLIGIVFLSFLLIWQNIQPTIAVYRVSDSDATSPVALIFEGTALRESSPKPKFGGVAGNIVAVSWSPMVAVANDKSLVVYQPRRDSDDFLEQLRDFGNAEAQSSWVRFEDFLTGLSQWANGGERAGFVPARLWASEQSRKKTLIVFCDLQALYDPARSGPDSDFVWHLEDQWNKIRAKLSEDFPDLHVVLFLSHGPGHLNLWGSPDSPDDPRSDSVFGQSLNVALDQLEQARSVLDFLTPTKLSVVEAKLSGVVWSLGDQLGYPQRVVRLSTLDGADPATASTELAELYWGKVASSAIVMNRKIPDAKDGDGLDDAWQKLREHQRQLLMERPEDYRAALGKLLCLEQLWAWRLVSGSEGDDKRIEAQYATTLDTVNSLVLDARVSTAAQPKHLSLWEEFAGSLRGTEDYWKLLEGTDVSEKYPDHVREWQALCTALPGAIPEPLKLQELLQTHVQTHADRYAKSNDFVLQEHAYVWRLEKELIEVLSKAANLEPNWEAVAWSVLCRDRANFLAAIYNPGLSGSFPFYVHEKDGLKSEQLQRLNNNFQAFEQDRRFLEDLLFANQTAAQEISVKFDYEFASQGLKTGPPLNSIAEGFRKLHELYSAEIQQYQAAVKLEIEARRKQLTSEFAHQYIWREQLRSLFRKDVSVKTSEAEWANPKLPDSKDAGSERQASVELLSPWLNEPRVGWRKIVRDHRPDLNLKQLLASATMKDVDDRRAEIDGHFAGDPLRNFVAKLNVSALDWGLPIPLSFSSPQRALHDRWETPQRGTGGRPVPYYEEVWQRVGETSELVAPFSDKPLDFATSDHRIAATAAPDSTSQGVARIIEHSRPSSSGGSVLTNIHPFGLPSGQWDKVAKELESVSVTGYFRGFITKEQQIVGPTPIPPNIPIPRTVQIKTARPLVDASKTSCSIALLEPRDYNVVFLIDGSSSMNQEWEFQTLGESQEAEKKRPADILKREMATFIEKMKTNSRVRMQLLLLSTSNKLGKDWSNPETTGIINLQSKQRVSDVLEIEFAERLQSFPIGGTKQVDGMPEELKKRIADIDFADGGGTPLEFGINYGIEQTMRPSNSNAEWIMCIISDGCDQIFAKRFLEDNSRVERLLESDSAKYKQFLQQNNSSDLLATADKKMYRRNEDSLRKYFKQIKYYNFLADTGINFDDNTPPNRLSEIFVDAHYNKQEVFRRIKETRERFRPNTLSSLKDITNFDPSFKVHTLRTDGTAFDRVGSLSVGSPFSQKLARPNVGDSWNSNMQLVVPPIPEFNEKNDSTISLPVRGGELFQSVYREKLAYEGRNGLQPSPSERLDTRWTPPISAKAFQRNFSLVDGANSEVFAGRPDFVFLKVKTMGFEGLLQDCIWEGMNGNRIRASFDFLQSSWRDGIDKVADTYIVRVPLDQPCSIWKHRFAFNRAPFPLGELGVEAAEGWQVRTELDPGIVRMIVEPPAAGVEDTSRIDEVLRHFVVQVVNKSGRLPANFSPKSVDRKFDYIDERLTRMVVEFKFDQEGDVLAEQGLEWGVTRLEDLEEFRERRDPNLEQED